MTKIEWVQSADGVRGRTWNPTTGCTKVSSGCANCYAERAAMRLQAMGSPRYQDGFALTLHEDELDIPIRRKTPTIWFVNSMSDLFHEDVPFSFIVRVFAVMALCQQHTFQVLTKRPERMATLTNDPSMPGAIYRQVSRWLDHLDGDPLGSGRTWDEAHRLAEFRGEGERWTWPLPNVWLGTSVENQPTAEERITHLRRCPAAIRFLSIEPLLGAIVALDFGELTMPLGDPRYYRWSESGELVEREISWVIVGGESGPRARTMEIAWLESIVDQCLAAGVPVFVKQDAGPQPGRQGRIRDDLWAFKQMPELKGYAGA